MADNIVTQESTELTKQKEFKPTPSMIVWLDTAMRLMTDNISEIERESSITAQAWYKWLKDDEFKLWFKREWDKKIAIIGPALDVTGFKMAKRGSFPHWESMQKRVGNLQEKGTSVQINNFVPILGGATKETKG